MALAPVLTAWRASFDVEDTFQDQFAGPLLAHPGDIIPMERLIELAMYPLHVGSQMLRAGNATVQIAERLTLAEQNSRNPGGFRKKMCDRSKTNARRHEKAVTNIAVALAENLQVDGQNQGAALGGAGTGDEIGDEAAIFHEVKLEPEGLLDSRRHILDRTDRHGAERVWDAGPFSGTRSGDFAITMRHSRHADRPQCERERDFFAEKRLRKIRGSRRQPARVGEF